MVLGKAKGGPKRLFRNDLLAQALGKLSRSGHMQGLGKFISASNYFHTIRGPIRSERERELDAWKKSVDAQLQEICRELKRTPRHLDMGSSIFPHNKDINNDSEEDVHQVASFITLTEFFLVYFSLYICHSIQFNLLFANNADRSQEIWASQLRRRGNGCPVKKKSNLEYQH